MMYFNLLKLFLKEIVVKLVVTSKHVQVINASVYKICLINVIALCILNHPCLPGRNLIWSWWMTVLKCCTSSGDIFFSYCLFGKIFIPPSLLKGSFAEHSALGWQFIPLKNYVTPFSSGLVSVEKFSNDLMGVSFLCNFLFLDGFTIFLCLWLFFTQINYDVSQCTPFRFNLLGVLGVFWTWICSSLHVWEVFRHYCFKFYHCHFIFSF